MNLPQKINLFQGTVLAIGSIMGSGILFLPSKTFLIAENSIILSWLLCILLCLPMIWIFYDFSKEVESPNGVGDFVRAGLGHKLGNFVPWLFLGTVSLGMPSSSLIAAEYLSTLTGYPLQLIAGAGLVAVAISLNFVDNKSSEKIQKTIAFGFLIIASVLIFLGSDNLGKSHQFLDLSSLSLSTASAALLAFWAFAGFENLTFMLPSFQSPKVFKYSMYLGLIICGVVYVAISAVYATQIPLNQVNGSIGLYQLANYSSNSKLLPTAISLFAIVAVGFNFVSWYYGLSRMLANSFYGNTIRGSVRKSLLIFLAIHLTVTCILWFNPKVMSMALSAVSFNFTLIYFLVGLSYILVSKRYNFSKFNLVVALIATVGFATLLANSIVLLAYPVSILVLSSFRRNPK